MDFTPTARSQDFADRLSRFMRDEIAPAEARYAAELPGGAARRP